jgi:rhodanese-related sulfurtransferase
VDELQSITREELRLKLEEGEQLVLVDALSPISYAASRLPGAISMPPGTVDERAPKRIPDCETPVVVYCTSETCDASLAVGRRLLELGYCNVAHYAGGKQEWAAAGLPLEGGRVQGPAATGATTTP